MNRISILLVLVVISWLGGAEPSSDPAVIAAQEAFAKEKIAIQSKADQELAKAKSKLDSAYQDAIKRAMAKGDLALANQLKQGMGATPGDATGDTLIVDAKKGNESEDAFKSGKVQYPAAAIRMPGQLNSHEEAVVLKAIQTNDLKAVLSGQKFEKTTPNDDKAFEGGGNHKESTYYAMNMSATKAETAHLCIKASAFSKIKVWVNGAHRCFEWVG